MEAGETLFLSTLTFVGGHFILSSIPVRRAIINSLGNNGFRILYSVFGLATFILMLMSYGDALYEPIWEPPMILRPVSALLMLIACIFMLSGWTTKSVTNMGGEKILEDEDPNAAIPKGILTVTRHPLLNGFAFWAIAHLLSNGDLATMILIGGLLILSVGGMYHIDHRRSITNRGSWGSFVLTTSILPFLAAVQGRIKVDWKGIGYWRPLGGIILFIMLLFAHPYIAGVDLIPHSG